MIIKEIDWVNGVTYGDGVVLENIPPQLQLPLYQSSPGIAGTEAQTGKNSDLLAEVTFLDENTINHRH